MNERIDKIVLQITGGSRVFLLQEEYLQLAELIIRECAILVDSKTEYSYGVADSWCQGKDVLEHFGLE